MVAVDAYTQSLDLDPDNATVFSNRSICWLRGGQPQYALTDAKAARKLAPYWPKVSCFLFGTSVSVLHLFSLLSSALLLSSCLVSFLVSDYAFCSIAFQGTSRRFKAQVFAVSSNLV